MFLTDFMILFFDFLSAIIIKFFSSYFMTKLLFYFVFKTWSQVNFGALDSIFETKRIILSSTSILVGFILIVFSFVSDFLNYLNKNG